jgi:hypothetical protein
MPSRSSAGIAVISAEAVMTSADGKTILSAASIPAFFDGQKMPEMRRPFVRKKGCPSVT